MNTKDKIKLCRRLAHSFRRADLNEDLIQEGMIALLEAEGRGYEAPGDFVMVARKRMQDFISLRQGPLSIAPSDKTRENAKAIRSGSEASVLNMEADTYNSLKVALEASTGLLEGDEVLYEDGLEGYLWTKQVEALMKQRLSETDFKVFQLRYGPEELTQREVSQALDMSERNVRHREHTIRKKMRWIK